MTWIDMKRPDIHHRLLEAWNAATDASHRGTKAECEKAWLAYDRLVAEDDKMKRMVERQYLPRPMGERRS